MKLPKWSCFGLWKAIRTLTHWGRATHICASKLTIISSDNGLSPGRRQAIIGANAGILLIRPLETNFSEISIEIYTFSFKKMHLKMSSGKCRPSCLGLNVLTVFAFGSWCLYSDIEKYLSYVRNYEVEIKASPSDLIRRSNTQFAVYCIFVNMTLDNLVIDTVALWWWQFKSVGFLIVILKSRHPHGCIQVGWLSLCRLGVICMIYVFLEQLLHVAKSTVQELLGCWILMTTLCLDTGSTSFSVSLSCREDLAKTSELPACSTLDLFRRRAPCELRDPQDTRALFDATSVSGDQKVHVGLNGFQSKWTWMFL